MLLTITTTHAPATDLGFLLHKNPSRSQVFDLAFGQAHVFYPEVGEDRCTAALLVEIDPIGLVRNRQATGQGPASLAQYVNDRPYAASSLFSVAIAQVYGSALGGHSKDRSELAETAIPLEATVTPVPCRGGEALLRNLFDPLGYQVSVTAHPLDERFPEWGSGLYFTVRLTGIIRLRDLLTHIYVLVPVLDDEKHYWVGEDEVAKLMRHGEPWLSGHPQRELIVNRYLQRKRRLVGDAMSRLVEDDAEDPDEVGENRLAEEEAIERPISLNEQRLAAVIAALREASAVSVIDLGCGEGRLLRELLKEPGVTRIPGLDVSHRALEFAARRLHLDTLPDRQRQRITLLHGSLTYKDRRTAGYDAACAVEVVEHLDPPRLASFERALFEVARPKTVVLTTPNVEYNPRFPTLPAGRLRHRDHRFEWTREQFQAWSDGVGQRFGYAVRFSPVGLEDPEVGAPTQMAVFSHE
jgi:3' terminal RNA ribose 2'-O-methyltransferase Hen1